MFVVYNRETVRKRSRVQYGAGGGGSSPPGLRGGRVSQSSLSTQTGRVAAGGGADAFGTMTVISSSNSGE
jgi:hypothetical protein